MKRSAIIIFISSVLIFGLVQSTETQCHPQCSWKCDDPHCPAICDPVCEPPKCHTSCAEPRNAICDVKCEKPQCEIKCPDKGCELLDCPKCVTVCQQPHCVTHCQAPKPECEPVCEEPRCDWKCHKPNCPKPKCELVCENPSCVPKVECCNCSLGTPSVGIAMPFFKETETNKGCCSCGANANANEDGNAGVRVNNAADFMTRPSSQVFNTGSHLTRIDNNPSVETFKNPVPVGTPQFTGQSFPGSYAFNRDLNGLNLQKNYHDRQ